MFVLRMRIWHEKMLYLCNRAVWIFYSSRSSINISIINFLPPIDYASFTALAFLLVAINLYYGPKINVDRVPMRWDLNGNPTWFGSKLIGLWKLVAHAILVDSLLLYKAKQSLPQQVTSDWILLIVSCCFLFGVHAWHVSAIVA